MRSARVAIEILQVFLWLLQVIWTGMAGLGIVNGAICMLARTLWSSISANRIYKEDTKWPITTDTNKILPEIDDQIKFP